MNPTKIELHLLALGTSKTEFADATGLSVFYVSRLCNGKISRPTRKTRQKLATGLKQLINERNVV